MGASAVQQMFNCWPGDSSLQEAMNEAPFKSQGLGFWGVGFPVGLRVLGISVFWA